MASIGISLPSQAVGGSAPAAGTATNAITASDGVQLARRTGKPVEVTGETTAMSTLTANPNGTLTVSQNAVPVRKKVSGAWQKLDATLRANADGTISPVLSGSELTFSGGGSGPLATMRQAGKTLALSAPMTLPKPTLLGSTATYPSVLPGVDLQVTAGMQGAFSQIFVVHNAAAAANPALRTLTMKTVVDGLTVSADAEGALAARDKLGKTVFSAAAPTMWGSAPVDKAGALRSAAVESAPTVALIGVKVSGDSIALTPDAALLNGPGTVYPVFIDPTWSPTLPTSGPPRSGYASVAKAFPTSSKWNNTADPNPDNMQLGWNNSPWHARTMVNFPIEVSKLTGANIISSYLNARSVYSGSCTQRKTRVFAPATTLGSGNATWNDWYNNIPLGAEVGSATFAGGYNSGCPATDNVFSVLPGVTSAVAAGRTLQTFVFTGDTNETSDTASYKELSLGSLNLQTTYNHDPAKPVGLFTSPYTACTGTVGTVGDGDVQLFAPVSDPDNTTVGVRFELWKTSAPGTLVKSSDPQTYAFSSGAIVPLTVDQPTLKAQAGTTITEFSWRVQIQDGWDTNFRTSPWSDTCKFNYDPTRPGAPQATAPADGATHIGQPVTIAVSKPVGGTIPASYLYQLNAGAPASIPADAAGNASITITPTRRTNTLTINAVSAGGNVSEDARALPFTTAPLTSNADDADFTGDGVADYVAIGNNYGLPSGVWLAPGKNNTQVATNATNIGANGNGVVGDLKPTNFNGAQLVTGIFRGTGLQDVMAYYPTTGAASLITGNGDGSTLMPQFSGNQTSFFDTELKDEGVSPSQLVNAGDAIGNTDTTDDLIGVGGPGASRHLNYYFYASHKNQQGIIAITHATPAGDMLWDEWKIATAQVMVGGVKQTDMFLWKPSTGALHLWRDLDVSSGDLLYANSYQLAGTGWNTGGTLNLQAADIDSNGTPDLWTTATGRTVTPYLTNAGTTTITAQTAQTLSSATHSWAINDIGSAANGDTISTTADNAPTGTTARNLAGVTGAIWHTGDLFSPDAQFNGSTGMLATSASVFATNGDFSVSAWVKPSTLTGTVLSQDGVNTAGFRLYADSSNKSWKFALSQSDIASPTWDTASSFGNSVQIGVWTQLTATYKQAGGIMNLYVNGVNVGTATHTTTWNATNAFRVGARRMTSSGHGEFYTGQVASVQTWSQVVDPAQAQSPASYYQRMTPKRLLDTRNGTGGTTGPVAGGGAVNLKIAGANGIPTTKVTAVAVNITVLSSTVGGYLTAYPDLTDRPLTTNVNYTVGDVVANFAIVPVGSNGYINIYVTGSTHLIADVSGYFTSDSAAAGNMTYTPVNPRRIVDSRIGLGGYTGQITGGAVRDFTVTGGGIPAGVKAVVVNITSAAAGAQSFFNTWEQGQTQPAVSGLQYHAGDAYASMAIVPVNAANGKFSLTSGAPSDVIIDLLGYFSDGTAGQKYHALNAVRLVDTRQTGSALGNGAVAYVAQGNTVVANNPTLVLNAIAISNASSGLVQAYPGDIATPGTSTINFKTGQVVANAVMVNTGAAGTAAFKVGSSGTMHLVVDCTGYFSLN